MTDGDGWRDDPDVPGRERSWQNGQWGDWVRVAGGEPLSEPYLGGAARWQYGVVALGAFNAFDRLAATLGELGHLGWELVTVYDKSSNWIAGMEQGFLLLKRPVPPGQTVPADRWCIAVNLAS